MKKKLFMVLFLTISSSSIIAGDKGHGGTGKVCFSNPQIVIQIEKELQFEIEASKESTDSILNIHVPITTLCPCSKEISEYGAHNQRGFIRLAVRFEDILKLNMDEFISELEELGSAQLYSLLKRVDEKFVTEQAYDNPGFVEDVIREVADYLNNKNSISWYRVEIENEESIHTHNAYALIEKDKRN